MQKRLLRDHYVRYFDAKARAAPSTRAAYLAARHITVVYTDNERLDFDRRLAANGLQRRHRNLGAELFGRARLPARLRYAGEHAEPAGG